jgi:zinc D-Ala-D-Ala carboxypeptidase
VSGTPVLTGPQTRAILVRLGWRIRNAAELQQAVRLFQRAWALGPPLAVDGRVGPLTSAALRLSESRRLRGQPTCAEHFSFAEFACKCGGRYSSCARIWVVRLHVLRLEVYRQKINRPVHIVSGCRCAQHNRAVGGASSSQHMYGVASDIAYAVTDATLRRWGLFSGLGRSATSRLVRHVDSRDLGGHNVTSGAPAHPTVWNYTR